MIFYENRHVKVARLSALGTDQHTFRKYPWYSLLLDGESTPVP